MMNNEDAVSEVVGEMLMIALVLVLIAVFGASISSFIPNERDPSITFMMTTDDDNITLWHKGGDWIRVSEITVTVRNDTVMHRYDHTKFSVYPETATIDLGSAITIPNEVQGPEEIRVFTPRIVLMTGRL